MTNTAATVRYAGVRRALDEPSLNSLQRIPDQLALLPREEFREPRATVSKADEASKGLMHSLHDVEQHPPHRMAETDP